MKNSPKHGPTQRPIRRRTSRGHEQLGHLDQGHSIWKFTLDKEIIPRWHLWTGAMWGPPLIASPLPLFDDTNLEKCASCWPLDLIFSAYYLWRVHIQGIDTVGPAFMTQRFDWLQAMHRQIKFRTTLKKTKHLIFSLGLLGTLGFFFFSVFLSFFFFWNKSWNILLVRLF